MRVFSAGYKLVILAEMNEILEIIFFNFRYFLVPKRNGTGRLLNKNLLSFV